MARRKRRRHGARNLELRFSGDLLDAEPVATLDLHGDSGPEAERRVRDFVLTHARISKGKVIRIITGKGRRSPKGPILPDVVSRTLRGKVSTFVEEFDRDLDEAGFLVRLR